MSHSGLFQHKVLALLEREGLITPERVALLLSWRHTGFSVHNSVRIAADDTDGLDALVRYLMRPPVSLARLQLLPGGQDVLHFPKGKGDDPGGSSPERIHAMEYVARVLSQIPEPRKHQVRYYGYYSCAARGKRLKDPLRSQEGSTSVHPNEPDQLHHPARRHPPHPRPHETLAAARDTPSPHSTATRSHHALTARNGQPHGDLRVRAVPDAPDSLD